jgi:hypothetical protein
MTMFTEQEVKMPKQRSGHVALVCDLNALTREQRQRYQTVAALLRASVEEVREIEAGYALRHPAEEPVLLLLAEFVGLERRCCPFLDFNVEVESEVGPVWLSITGEEGVKRFLRAELGLDGDRRSGALSAHSIDVA